MNRSGPPSQLDSPSTPASPLLGYFCCIAVSAPSPLMCVCLSFGLCGRGRTSDKPLHLREFLHSSKDYASFGRGEV